MSLLRRPMAPEKSNAGAHKSYLRTSPVPAPDVAALKKDADIFF